MESLEFINQDELLAEIELRQGMELGLHAFKAWKALRAIVELHKPDKFGWCYCSDINGKCPTKQAIEKELK